MDIRIIKSPSAGTVDILLRRKGSDRNTLPPCTDAIGLVQGKMIDMSWRQTLQKKRWALPSKIFAAAARRI